MYEPDKRTICSSAAEEFRAGRWSKGTWSIASSARASDANPCTAGRSRVRRPSPSRGTDARPWVASGKGVLLTRSILKANAGMNCLLRKKCCLESGCSFRSRVIKFHAKVCLVRQTAIIYKSLQNGCRSLKKIIGVMTILQSSAFQKI